MEPVKRIGKLIVVEGSDGSGKGTQFGVLAERLRGAGYSVAVFEFPQFQNPSSHFVQQYAHGTYGPTDQVSPYTASMFYALDRFDVARQIHSALEQGYIVLSNCYTGSNMAQQGVKFGNDSERRGFFIWLDGLEYQLLGIPRPDANIILSMPATVAQSLVNEKSNAAFSNSVADQTKVSLESLSQSVSTYQQLCSLFPKDFTEVVCAENGETLSVATVSNKVWGIIQTVLPPADTLPKLPAYKSEAIAPTQNKKIEQIPSTPEQVRQEHIENASQLLLQNLRSSAGQLFFEQPIDSNTFEEKDERNRYKYYTPKLPQSLRHEYTKALNQIFERYTHMVKDLSRYIQKHTNAKASHKSRNLSPNFFMHARKVLLPILPLAATSSIDIFGRQQAHSEMSQFIQASGLAESLSFARQLGGDEYFNDLIGIRQASTRKHATVPELNKLLSTQKKPSEISQSTESVTLVDYWPKNEADLVADMVYKDSHMPLTQLRQITGDWNYVVKRTIFKTYCEASLESKNLELAASKAHYNWDIVCSYTTFLRLQKSYIISNLHTQPLVAAGGIETPSLVSQANIEHDFQTCVRLSELLYTRLTEAGKYLEAQYAVLHGHNVRLQISANATEVARLMSFANSDHTDDDLMALLRQMTTKLQEVHPLLSEAISLSN